MTSVCWALPVAARCSRPAPLSASKRVSGALAPLAENLRSISLDIGTHGTDTGG